MNHHDHHHPVIIAASEEPLLELLSHTLHSYGIGADVARSHRELLERCRHHRYQLIISRFLHPLISSPEEARRLRGEGGATHLFLLSHTRDEKIVVTLLERGANQFLSLPVSLSRLARKVRLELEKYRPLCR